MDENIQYYKNERPEIVPLLPEKISKVLEIGCGEGRFRANLPQDCEYIGVEMSAVAAKVAAEKLTKVLVGTYAEVSSQLPENYFDLIICNDVVEHMPDHNAFLEEIKQKMSPDSYIVGSIPNVRHLPHLLHLLVKKEWQYEEEGILDKTHLRFFTSKSWRRTLTEHGFDVQALEGLNEIGLGRTILKRLVKRSLIGVLGSDTKFLQFGFRAKMLSHA